MKNERRTVKRKNNKRGILFRYELAILAILIVAGGIIYELTRTTIKNVDEWNDKANRLLTDTVTIVPERGALLSDNGTILADNLMFYSVCIDTKTESIRPDSLKKHLPALADSLAAFSRIHNPDNPRSAQRWKDTLEHVYEQGTNRAFTLFRRASHDEVQRIKSFPFFNLKPRYTGLYTTQRPVRTKPYGMMASRSIGNVLEREDRKGFRGSSGLEMALDSLLYGTPGVAENVQLTSGISKWTKTPALPGYNVTTTINVTMQEIAEEQLLTKCRETNARWGTVVLMEVETGEIKAISNLEWNPATGDYAEGVNHAVLGYEPGSVMKPISMMVALEEGLVKDIDAPIQTGTHFMYYGRPINDPHGGAYLTAREIIATSSNVGMSKIIISGFGNRPGGFREKLEQMGFFEPFHSGIGGERAPAIAKLGHSNADHVALTRMAYGYTTMLPPLCTLAMYNAIANDGKYVRPTLVKRLTREGEDSIMPVSYIKHGMWKQSGLVTEPVQVCSPENAAKLRQMLHDVVWGPRGTARNFLKSDLVEIAGKTGTCFTNEGGHYTNTKRLAFCGFFPYEKPKYSCIVLMLGANVGAAASSGLVLKNIALKLYAHGLLDNSPSIYDQAKGKTTAVKTQPTVYATHTKQNYSKLAKATSSANVATIAKPKAIANGVPDVHGLSIREALGLLEEKGITVSFNGQGFVKSQSVPPGTPLSQCRAISLTLSL